ncbi:VirK/YbjX family protein [Pleomorphomonas oryzae]|uniref:VirK/YbjX family protein n=1 Tax=Pleomorphomonas oryzae TaxID=261934 RepID=UPI0003FA6000|nr:DUF535 family protein [Pleomorphomonas oryzae]
MNPSFVGMCLDRATLLYPSMRSDALRRRVHFLLRCLWWRRSASEWFRHIEATAPLRDYVASHPFIAAKPFSRYMRLGWRLRDRLNCLRDHYELMLSCPAGQRLLDLCASEATIASLRGRSGADYHLVLTSCALHMREGEMLIELRRDQRRVCCLAGSFCRRDGQLVFLVGTLQGAKGEGAKDFTREVTKDLHQLRPRDLAMAAAQTIGSIFAVSAILAPSQKRHVQAGQDPKGLVKADFEDLWTDLGGERRHDGEFVLPLETQFKAVEDIPSKKRAETLRRYALKHQMADDIRAALGQPASAKIA